MQFLRPVLFFIFLLFWARRAAAQESAPLITADFKNATIDEFVQPIEKQTNHRFYFNPIQFDSFRLTLSVNRQSLNALLERAFRGTGYFFAIDDEQRVFLTKGDRIFTALGGRAAYNRTTDSVAQRKWNPNVKDGALAESKLYEIGNRTAAPAGGRATLEGYVYDTKTGDPVPGASVSADGGRSYTTTDTTGHYTLDLTTGRHTLSVKDFGKKETRRQLMVYGDGTLSLPLQDQASVMQEVIISTRKQLAVNRPQLGVERLTVKTIKQVPTVFGEADVLRVITTLPGVKTVGEATTGFNVRGGAADQNLILFNDATIYNPSHFFGLFSAFNPEMVKDVELYKSSVPARYGGRLASVLAVNSREGSKKEYSGTAGIGLITSRLNVEGPIAKNKSSFLIGGRTTYSNWLLNLFPEKVGFKNSKASFYDINAVITQSFNENNDVTVTGYWSKDRFNLNSDTLFGYRNRNISVKWRHAFNKKLEANLIAGYDGYEYENGSEQNPVNAYKLLFDIQQANIKAHATYTVNANQAIEFGVHSIRYKLRPGSFLPQGAESKVVPDIMPDEQALESAAYVEDRYDVNEKLSVSAGLRYSLFNYLGAQAVNVYAPNVPKDKSSLVETVTYKRGDVIQTYGGPEVRFSAKYSLTPDFSVKAGYNTLRQYIHVLSNTTAISPTDIWKLSDPNIKPQFGDQVSIGFFKFFGSDSLELSAEFYYKRLKNYLDYKSGASLVLNHHIETDVINTKGKAYGAELLLKKRAGKLNGWIGYTFSRILLKMDDPNIGPVVNRGEFYPANYDKPHDATLVGNYRINQRFSISLNVTYSTGRPITLPIGRYYYGGSQRALYSDRNAYRTPYYFRSDFSMNIEGNHKVKQATHNSWTIGLYNITGRKNAYSVYFTSENGVVNGYKLSVFGSVIPFINYNIRF